MLRTFYFNSLTEAAKRCEEDGLPFAGIIVTKRNSNGRVLRCQMSVPANLYGSK